MGADAGSPVELLRQHGESDALLIGSGLPFTILQPNSFYQNMFWSAGTIKDHGAFYLPIGDARQSQVDVRDIASVAVKALTDPALRARYADLGATAWPTSPAEMKAFRESEEGRLLPIMKAAGVKPE